MGRIMIAAGKRKRYLLIKNGIVINAISCDDKFAQWVIDQAVYDYVIDGTDLEADKDWFYDGINWTAPALPPVDFDPDAGPIP